MLLDKLTQFYKDEKAGLPHNKADLFEIAWELADILEDWGESSNAWKGLSMWSFDEFVHKLRTEYTSALIDIAVDTMHQSLLDQFNEDTNIMMLTDGNIKNYLLKRNSQELIQEYENVLQEQQEEFEQELKWQELEAEFDF